MNKKEGWNRQTVEIASVISNAGGNNLYFCSTSLPFFAIYAEIRGVLK
jgi:hypothetical protein